jgi:hypothetical protein
MRVMCGIVLVRLSAASVLLSHSPGKNLTRFLAAGSLLGGFFIERWFVDQQPSATLTAFPEVGSPSLHH